MNYSKGDWKTHKNALGQWIVFTDNELIAQVERHYNTKLITAAPDLYEALKEITEQFGLVDNLYTKDHRIISRAEQALAKAEGVK